MDFNDLQKLCVADFGVTDAKGFLLSHHSQQKSFVVSVAVGAMETHSTEGVARNGSRIMEISNPGLFSSKALSLGDVCVYLIYSNCS